MNANHRKAGIVGAALSSALLLGGGALAYADTTSPANPGSSSTTEQGETGTGEKNDKQERDEATFTGTIAAPAENEAEAADGSPEEKAQDQAELAELQQLATVTEEQARQAATGSVPGTVNTIELDDEGGFVVWEVDITKDDGTTVEVLVDAGDASILAQETD